MAHEEKRGARKAATEEQDDLIPRTAQVLPPGFPQAEPEHVQSAESDADPGEELRRARMRAALDFSEVIDSLGVSRRQIASRHVHIDDTTIRKWCTGDKPIPWGAIDLLPERVVVAMVKRALARRGIKL